MAINLSEFEETRHVGIKRDKKNHHRFLIEYTVAKKRYRSVFNADQYLGKRDSLNAAYIYREGSVNDKKQSIAIGNDIDADVDTYFKLFIEKKLNESTKENYTSVYNLHIKPHIGSKKVRDITSEKIEDILFILEKDKRSVSMQRRVWMTLKFLFELAVI